MKPVSNLLGLEIPLVLASGSPRRHHLLKTIGFEFTIITADIDETLDINIPPEQYCMNLARSKAVKVADNLDYEAVVLGADTIVVLDGRIINKPSNSEEAVKFLKDLSGNTHLVYTAIAIVNSKTGKTLTKYGITRVTFRELEDEEITAYVESGSPMDKAGAYGIQDDFGAVFVKHVEGCYYNIVGLPLELLYSSLKEFLKG